MLGCINSPQSIKGASTHHNQNLLKDNSGGEKKKFLLRVGSLLTHVVVNLLKDLHTFDFKGDFKGSIYKYIYVHAVIFIFFPSSQSSTK